MSVEDKKRLGRRFFKGYTKLVESKYWYNHYVGLIFGASPASNLGSLIAIDWKGNELISVTRFFGNNDNVKLYLGSNPETNMYELWLGLIGLDGDGSEFIIQSRESIDLDSKTVETLPSYLKVISISWQKNNDFSELGELLGNPKGTKSFSSWSEFTDFVNEMPIKTIQPFVSNFNAFAGEGFYGNVVQGLVIKQLEDAVFIFGIAIDGTLIFRKRNYPDVSTWEDPKIIIHSNNWHKIYFVTDLGGLIGINNTWFRTRSQYKGSILQAPTGIYRPAPGVITDTLSGGGLILVFRMDNNNACVFQVTGNGILAVRTMNVNNGKWSDWDTIANPSFPT